MKKMEARFIWLLHYINSFARLFNTEAYENKINKIRKLDEEPISIAKTLCHAILSTAQNLKVLQMKQWQILDMTCLCNRLYSHYMSEWSRGGWSINSDRKMLERKREEKMKSSVMNMLSWWKDIHQEMLEPQAELWNWTKGGITGIELNTQVINIKKGSWSQTIIELSEYIEY